MSCEMGYRYLLGAVIESHSVVVTIRILYRADVLFIWLELHHDLVIVHFWMDPFTMNLLAHERY